MRPRASSPPPRWALSGFVKAAPGVYTFTGSAPEATAALRALFFDPANGRSEPGLSETTIFTITVDDGAGGTASTTASVIAREPNAAPTITGAQGGQAIGDKAALSPFSGVTIADADRPVQTLAATVKLDGADKGALSGFSTGSYDAASGTYTVSGTQTAVTLALRRLVFTPTENRLAPGLKETATFTIALDDGRGGTATDAETSVIVTSLNDAPTAVADARALAQRGVAFDTVLGNDRDIDAGDGWSYRAGVESKLAAGEKGTDSFTYTATDKHGGTASAVLKLTVTGSETGNDASNIFLLDKSGYDVDGKGGSDTASFAARSGEVQVTLNGDGESTVKVAGKTYGTLQDIENLIGGSGDDRLAGDGSVNTLRGGGNDTLRGGRSGDRLEGGSGLDTASYRTATSGVIASLADPAGNTGEAEGDTYSSIQNLHGSSHSDRLTGNGGKNTLTGDYGSDILAGGLASDTLTGGTGGDRFVFDTKLSARSNVDTITDFTPGTDTIRLDDDVFSAAGKFSSSDADGRKGLSFAAFWASDSGKAHDKSDRILYGKTDGRLYYDADGTDAGARVLFANLDAHLKITAADFVLTV